MRGRRLATRLGDEGQETAVRPQRMGGSWVPRCIAGKRQHPKFNDVAPSPILIPQLHPLGPPTPLTSRLAPLMNPVALYMDSYMFCRCSTAVRMSRMSRSCGSWLCSRQPTMRSSTSAGVSERTEGRGRKAGATLLQPCGGAFGKCELVHGPQLLIGRGHGRSVERKHPNTLAWVSAVSHPSTPARQPLARCAPYAPLIEYPPPSGKDRCDLL